MFSFIRTSPTNLHRSISRSSTPRISCQKDQRRDYLAEVAARLDSIQVDVIGVSAGFDNHVEDWGRTLHTEDYREMGRMVHAACRRMGAGSFGLLEGGYNHDVLGTNVREFLKGLQGP